MELSEIKTENKFNDQNAIEVVVEENVSDILKEIESLVDQEQIRKEREKTKHHKKRRRPKVKIKNFSCMLCSFKSVSSAGVSAHKHRNHINQRREIADTSVAELCQAQ